MAINRIYSIIENNGNTMVPINKISNHIRRNNDDTKHLIEWIHEEIPPQFQTMNYEQTRAEMMKPEWLSDE